MNNEIKEMNLSEMLFNRDERLLDLITNLQQRIEGLETENETLRSDFKNQVEYTNKIAEENERIEKEWKSKLDDVSMLTSRISKAIELIKEAGCYNESTKSFNDDIWDELPDLLNILQNGSDDNE